MSKYIIKRNKKKKLVLLKKNRQKHIYNTRTFHLKID